MNAQIRIAPSLIQSTTPSTTLSTTPSTTPQSEQTLGIYNTIMAGILGGFTFIVIAIIVTIIRQEMIGPTTTHTSNKSSASSPTSDESSASSPTSENSSSISQTPLSD